jgi:hypothetical protein
LKRSPRLRRPAAPVVDVAAARVAVAVAAAAVARVAAPTLQSVSTEMLAAAMAMQGAEAAPTAREVAACTNARTESATVMARWTKLTTIDLAALNAKRKAAGQPVVVIPKR